jgi:hypothetical protein
MSAVNRKILETIEKGDFTPELKELLNALLTIEARNAEDKKPRYSEDYDRIIKKLAERHGYQEDK